MAKKTPFFQTPAAVYLTGILSLVVIGIILLPIQHPLSLDDGIRHLTLAELLYKNGLSSFSGWGDFLYTGYFNEVNIDPWYYSHVLLMPLSPLPFILRIKAYILLSAAFLLGSFWIILRSMKIKPFAATFLTLFLLFGDRLFFGRLFLARPFSIITTLCLLSVYAVIHRKWIIALCITLAASMLSHLFIFPLGICGLGALWLWLIHEKKTAYRILGGSIGGVLLGIALNPNSVGYLQYLFTVFLQPAFSKNLGVGMELYSGLGLGSLIMEPVIGISIIMTVFALHKEKKKLSDFHKNGVTFTAFLAVLFMLLYYKWARMIDFAWPLVLLLVAQLHTMTPRFSKEVHKTFVAFSPSRPVFVYIFVCLFLTLNVVRVGLPLVQGNKYSSLEHYAELSVIPSGAKVLNPDWALFPVYFTVRPDLLYSSGMDPTFNYVTDEDGHLLMHLLRTQALHLEEPIVDGSRWWKQVREHYEADYFLLSNERHENILKEFSRIDELEKVSSDKGVITIFKVRK